MNTIQKIKLIDNVITSTYRYAETATKRLDIVTEIIQKDGDETSRVFFVTGSISVPGEDADHPDVVAESFSDAVKRYNKLV